MFIYRKTTRLFASMLAMVVIGACAEAPKKNVASVPNASLAGTSWQLVKFQGGDDRIATPDDRTKYTIAFHADGSTAVRIDCNQGRGTWKSAGPNELELGLVALTRAMCAPGSMHDDVVKHWSFVRSYILKNGHLYLSLMADGGIYEFEPTTKK